MIKGALKIIPVILLLFFITAFYLRPLLGSYYTSNVRITEVSLIESSILTLFLLLAIPFSWLYLMNGKSIREILEYLKIRKDNVGMGIVYGVIGFSVMMIVLLIIGAIIKSSGADYDNPLAREIARSLSIPSIIFIAVAQSSGEEIFFRGFLMEKLSFRKNYHIGIFLSSLLFGFAHLSYNQIYQVIIPIAIGIIFGYIVVKSRNIVSSIIPHVSYNLLALLLARYISLTL